MTWWKTSNIEHPTPNIQWERVKRGWRMELFAGLSIARARKEQTTI